MVLNRLVTKRLIIETLSDMDFGFLQTLYGDIKNYAFATGSMKNRVHDLQLDLTNHDDHFFFVAKKKQSKQAIGCIKGQIHPTQGIIWISMLIIVLNEQKKGYGSELLACFCTYWKTNFVGKAIFISVDGENRNGLAFWYKMGFELHQSRQKKKEHEIGSISGLQQILILKKEIK